jgi:[ribosomal protein S5]-alanine N-acetyltransferase
MRTIETGNLILEPQTAAHADVMFAVLSDPAIDAYENEPPPSAAWLRDRFTKLETRLSADGQERLGFALVSPGQHLAHPIEPDEVLMCLRLGVSEFPFLGVPLVDRRQS